MRPQLAGSNCCFRTVVSVLVIGNVLFGNLLHKLYRNLLEMCLGLVHSDYSLLIFLNRSRREVVRIILLGKRNFIQPPISH